MFTPIAGGEATESAPRHPSPTAGTSGEATRGQSASDPPSG
jgi:hypothetical protein